MNNNINGVSKASPCQHCGKPDWCYRIGDDLEVCKRDAVADGWEATSKADQEGSRYLRLIPEKKSPRPASTRIWYYPARDGSQLLKIVRIDDGNGSKKVLPYRWLGDSWAKNSGYSQHVKRTDIPIYEYKLVQNGIKANQQIFITEGEPCADALISLGLIATTNIGGGGKWHDSDTKDLIGASTVVLCPDRDKLGIEHIKKVALSIKKLLPKCQIKCLFAPPGKTWGSLPSSQGLDVADWIADYDLTITDVLKEVQPSVDSTLEVLKVLNFKESTLDVNDTEHEFERSECWSVVSERELRNFSELREAHRAKFDVKDFLPLPISTKIIHDSRILNIDPVSIFQYLLPATASLMGKNTILDMNGFKVPCILWCVLVQRSGGGKSRAHDAALETLNLWQEAATEQFQEDYAAWKKAQDPRNKRDSSDQPSLEKPKSRKYVFNVCTPQAIVKRLSDQEYNGCLLARDELKGIFRSLDQFTGEGEGLEILLESWDGKGCAVDRADVENSYYIPSSRLSIAGGLQPGVFNKVFSDPDDCQGVLARFLLAVPQDLPAKRIKGECQLGSSLPLLYQWVQDQNWGVINPTPEADDLFTQIYEQIGNERCPNEATKAWNSKLAGQILRIALPLHAIDCYYNRAKNISLLAYDTLQKAYKAGMYYKNCYYKLQGLVAGTSISGILAKILAKAQSAPNPEAGLAMADIYRNFNILRTLAKEENVSVAELTLNLCREIEALELGKVFKKGKSYYFAAYFREYPPKNQHFNTRTAETYTGTDLESCVDFSRFNTFNTSSVESTLGEDNDSPEIEE